MFIHSRSYLLLVSFTHLSEDCLWSMRLEMNMYNWVTVRMVTHPHFRCDTLYLRSLILQINTRQINSTHWSTLDLQLKSWKSSRIIVFSQLICQWWIRLWLYFFIPDICASLQELIDQKSGLLWVRVCLSKTNLASASIIIRLQTFHYQQHNLFWCSLPASWPGINKKKILKYKKLALMTKP